MLQISRAQLNKLEGVQQARFIDDCCRMLKAEQRAAAATPHVDLRRIVVSMVEQLKGFGFVNTAETEYAVSLIYRYQQEPERGPVPAEISALMRSDRFSTEKKIEALEQLFIFGPQNPKEPFVARVGEMRS